MQLGQKWKRDIFSQGNWCRNMLETEVRVHQPYQSRQKAYKNWRTAVQFYSETCTACKLKWRHEVIDGEGLGKIPGMVLDRNKTKIPSSHKYILCISWWYPGGEGSSGKTAVDFSYGAFDSKVLPTAAVGNQQLSPEHPVKGCCRQRHPGKGGYEALCADACWGEDPSSSEVTSTANCVGIP